jgi:ABC-2 type transport system permease protein
MTSLVLAELLKFRTTRMAIGVLLAAVLLTGIAAAGTVGSARGDQLGTSDFSRDVLSSALITTLIVFLLGVVSVTTEWRHGTVTRTFLITPQRARVLVAKELWIVGLGAVLFVLALVITLAVAVPWLSIRGSSLEVDSHLLGLVGRGVLATMVWGVLGVGVGAIVQNQTAALIGAIIWVLPVEALATALLGVFDLEELGDYLPARAVSAFDGTVEDGLSPWAGGAVALGYGFAFAAAGWFRIRRQDIT